MSSPITADLFLSLIILTSLILSLTMLYFLLRCFKQNRQPHPSETTLESGGYEGQRDSRRLSPDYPMHPILQGHYAEQRQIASMPPFIEYLPQIQLSDDKAEEWLERGRGERVDVVCGDLGVKQNLRSY